MFCECHDIMVRYGQAVVLNVKHLAIPVGKITGILGHNGAGKTTLMEVMALLRRPTRGRVCLWGQEALPSDRELQRKIVMVMHAGYMFHGSVLDNVTFGLKARKISSHKAKTRAAKALKIVELSELAQQNAAQLSAGQRQRVNLARAIAIGPRAVLLDEPAANVDSQTVEIICNLLCQLRDQQGTTIVHTCPANGQLRQISDQFVELTNGQVQNKNENKR